MGGGQSKPSSAASTAAAAAAENAPSAASSRAASLADGSEGGAIGGSGVQGGGGEGGRGGGGGCPVKHGSGGGGGGFSGWFRGSSGGLPEGHPSAAAEGGCPVKGAGGQVQYNVYSQPIDPTNQMPAVANQLPHPSQKGELSTERVRSTIPKGGADDGTTWTYPSPQMFYNSLARKGKLASDLGGSSSSGDDDGDGKEDGDKEDADEEAMMESVVALHNNMNEKTWSKVLEWEAVSDPSGQSAGGPKLLKFLGRPSDLSPKARFKTWCLIHPLPFDRHDWTVVRPDGTEVRYVIDYYHDEASARTDEDSAMPDMHDRHAVKSILVDVRPAIDGPRSLFDRAVKMPYARRVAESTQFEPLPMSPTPQLRDQFVESMRTWQSIQENAKEDAEAARAAACRSDDKAEDEGAGAYKTIKVGDTGDKDAEVKVTLSEARSLSSSLKSMLKSCASERSSLESCADDAECARSSLALTMCMGKSACPVQHAAVQASLLAKHDPNNAKAVEEYNARLDKALENVSACVAGVSERAAVARMVHPQAFDDDKDK